MRRKGNPSALLVGMQTGEATVENSMEFPQKTKNGTALWPSNLAAGILPEEPWNPNRKEPMHPNIHSNTIYNSQVLKATYVPISKRVDPKTMVYLHNGILHSREKEVVIPFAMAWMELESIMLSNKPGGEGQIPYDITFN